MPIDWRVERRKLLDWIHIEILINCKCHARPLWALLAPDTVNQVVLLDIYIPRGTLLFIMLYIYIFSPGGVQAPYGQISFSWWTSCVVAVADRQVRAAQDMMKEEGRKTGVTDVNTVQEMHFWGSLIICAWPPVGLNGLMGKDKAWRGKLRQKYATWLQEVHCRWKESRQWKGKVWMQLLHSGQDA
jgi:hypothetical protein